MAVRKYDWDQLLNQFLLSDFDEVQEFLRQTFSEKVAQSGGARAATNGWPDKKKQFKAKIREEVMLEEREKAKDRERQNLDIASAMENLALLSAHARLKSNLTLDANGRPIGAKLTTHEIEKVFNMSRIEQGKTINNTENTNKNTEVLNYIDSVTNGPTDNADQGSDKITEGIGLITAPKPTRTPEPDTNA